MFTDTKIISDSFIFFSSSVEPTPGRVLGKLVKRVRSLVRGVGLGAGGRGTLKNRARIRRAGVVVPISDLRGLDLPHRSAEGDQRSLPCAAHGAQVCLAASSVDSVRGCALLGSVSLVS